jgi:transcriptional regulator with XRE-family HTH domain
MYASPGRRKAGAALPPGTVTLVLGVRIDGERLRRLLLARAGNTQRAMAAFLSTADPQIKVSGPQLGQWFAGKFSPQPDMLARILRVVRADLLDVLPEGTSETLEVLRWRSGMTAIAVARATGISRPRYDLLEAGEVPDPSEVRALAEALGVEPRDIERVAGEHAEITIVVHLDAAEAARVRQQQRPDEQLHDTVRRLINTALDANE